MRRSVIAFALTLALLGGCTPESSDEDLLATGKLLIFHNGTGPMCLEALDWLDSIRAQYPDLVIEEHLTYESGETNLLNQLTARFSQSQGVSTSFAYLPIVFYQYQAFSGFNDDVRDALAVLIDSAVASSS